MSSPEQIPLVPTALAVAVAAALVAPGSAAQATLWELSGAPDSRFGHALAMLGDTDGDGLPELVIGAPGDDAAGEDAGRVFLVDGATGATLHVWTGEAAFDNFGVAVADAGDVDADGVPDVLVGAYRHDTAGDRAGRAYVFSGASFAALHVLDGAAADDEFGIGVDGVGDLDGDGHDDFAVGAHHSSEVAHHSGSVRVFSGATAELLHLFVGDELNDDLGHVLAGAGDVDGDGVPDVIGGLHDNPDPGRARVYSGATGALLHEFDGVSNGDFYGHAVASAGDVDGDGLADLVVGASRDDQAGTNAGRAELRAGSDGAVLAEWFGTNPGDEFGLSVWSAGDFDGDGCPDQIVGIPGADAGGTNAGGAEVRSGLDGSLIVALDGVSQGLRFDAVVTGGADLDGDGGPEVAVGFPYDDVGGPDTGRVRVWSGGPPVWSGFGAGLAGTLGVPALTAKGLLEPGSSGSLRVTGAAPSSPCLLAVSLQGLGAPFKGGVLHAFPIALQVLAGTNASGAFGVAWSDWPADVPPGTTLVVQAAVADPGAPLGAALTPAVSAVTP